MITRLRIEQLFNRFDYDLDFNKGGVSILTGPNGYGKSTILRLLESFNDETLSFLFELEFQRILIFIDDNRKYIIEKDDKNLKFDNSITVPIDRDDKKELSSGWGTRLLNRHEVINYADIKDHDDKYVEFLLLNGDKKSEKA